MAEVLSQDNSTTFSATMEEGEFSQTSIIVGGQDPSSFAPNINFSRWYDEGWVNLNIRSLNISETARPTFVDGVAEITVGDLTLKSWVLRDNILEFAVVFASQPLTTTIEFEIQDSGNLDYYYQGTIEDDIPESFVRQGYERPDNVVGSYAIKIKNKRNNEYKTGKWGHWFRWECIDNDGKKEWCDPLRIENGNLIIGLPSAFMSTAKYPVTVMGAGDTFGNDQQGASDRSLNNAMFSCADASPVADGTSVALHAYIKDSGNGSKNFKMALYDASDNGFIVGSNQRNGFGGTYSDETFTIAETTVEAAKSYIIPVWSETAGAGTAYVASDTDGTSSYDAETFNGWPETYADDPATVDISTWCFYTAGETHPLAGTIAGSATPTGALIATRAMIGTIAATATPTGAMIATKAMIGTITAAASLTANLIATRVMQGTISAVSSLSAFLGRIRPLAGAISAASTVTGTTIGLVKLIAGTISAVSSLTGAIVATRAMQGVITAASTLTGALIATKRLAGTVAAAATVTGAMIATRALAGVITAASTVSGALTTVVTEVLLAGVITAASSMSGALVATKSLVGTIASSATVTGSMVAVKRLAGTISSVATVTGAAIATKILSGTIAAAATVTGALTTVVTTLAATLKGVELLTRQYKVIKMKLKSGSTQAAAGASEGELWVDTDDQTIKLGS